MTKERKGEVCSGMRVVPSHYDKINIYSKIRHPVLIKFNLSREQRRRSLLSQRRLGLAANRPSSLCTMIRTYLPDDDNDLLLMTLTNHTMFERLIKNITNEQSDVESHGEQIEEQEVIMQEEIRSGKENNNNDNSCIEGKQEKESNKMNTIEQREKVECQEQKVRHAYNNGQTKNLTELIACANPAFYYHCEMKILDDGRTIQEQLYGKKLPQRKREEELECIRQHNRTFCERDEELKVCRALARNVVENRQIEKYDISDNMLNKRVEDNQYHNVRHKRTSRHHVNQENTEVNNMTDRPLSKTSALMSKSSPSPSSGIISQSRNRWERHLQDELQHEGETVESFRQSKGQESYVSKHKFAQQVQWNEYQRELQMEYAQSEQQRKRERKRLIEEKFEA